MKPTVFLADLRHTYMGVLSSDAMPLNVGYMKAVMDRDLPEVASRLFVYPENLLSALTDTPPDVLMLSNYTWNEQLSLRFAKIAKAIRPETLVVMGGPNFPDELQSQTDYLGAHPQVDVYAVGEGDFLATDLVAQFLDAGKSLTALAKRDLASSVYRVDGGYERRDVLPRNRQIDEIPSPWLTGIMDEFFDGRLAPLWETNRGCPFQCTFCVQGTGYYNKVTYFDETRLHDEIHYIGKLIHERSPAMGTLRIADPNYGMYKRDPRVSGYIGEVQAQFGFPTYIDATTGKNRPDRIIESMEKVGGALVLYQAVQSLDEDVLRRINRQNIKLEAYAALEVHMRGRGLRSSSDLILGLPGETLKSHLAGLFRMIDAGVSKLNNFQCMLLKGTKMERPETREQFKFVSRFRVVPKSFGVYGEDYVFEDEEIIVGTDTMSFDDYLNARTHHLACAMFLNSGRLESVFRLTEKFGLKRSAVFAGIVDAMRTDQGEVGRLVANFIEETRNELFESREELVAFYRDPDNAERLRNGQIGDNLVYRYSALAALRAWEHVNRLAHRVVRSMLDPTTFASDPQAFDEFWENVYSYQTAKYASGTTRDAMLAPAEITLSYDVGRWIDDGGPQEFANYRIGTPTPFEFRIAARHTTVVERAIETYGLNELGASMLIKRVLPEHLEREAHQR